jgi:esterase/lipase superfamily enzyme
MGVVPNWEDYESDIAIINTRGNFRNGRLARHRDRFEYTTQGTIPGMAEGTDQPEDLLIIIHGFNNDEEVARNACGLARDSLLMNDFDSAIIGYAWDADTQLDPNSMIGYHEGSLHAEGNGTKLARFIIDYKSVCPDTRVHILAYCMGTRVVAEMLYALDNDDAFADLPMLVESIHFVASDIPNEKVQTNSRYGAAIENNVRFFFNYYSNKDKVLGVLYRLKVAGNQALGCMDIRDADFIPSNYQSIDASAELKVLDMEGNFDVRRQGYNHLGVLGLLNAEGDHIDDGEMNLVANSIQAITQ